MENLQNNILKNDKYFIQIKDYILEFFNKDIKIILFGSRAGNTFRENSDYDIAIVADDEDKQKNISLIKEMIENSTIPNKIDIVDYYNVSDDFKKNIDKGHIWKE